jgi:hypothetical protein
MQLGRTKASHAGGFGFSEGPSFFHVAMNQTTVATEPTTTGKIEALIFWLIAGLLGSVTATVVEVPNWLWTMRLILIAAGVLLAIGLIAREKYRTSRGLPLDRDSGIVDPWTIAHWTAGLVMGAWGIPFPLVALFTIAWEFFEYLVPGFGDQEIFSNRLMDIGIAWVGWLMTTAPVAAATHTAMPWILPSAKSIVGNALHLH